jgi:hypothetical protein
VSWSIALKVFFEASGAERVAGAILTMPLSLPSSRLGRRLADPEIEARLA